MNTPYLNSFLTALERNQPEDNLELARTVRELVAHPGWEIVQDLLGAYAEELDRMTMHGVHEQAVYASRVAERKAMSASRDAATAVITSGDRAEARLNEMVAMAAGEMN